MNKQYAKNILTHPDDRLWTVQGFGKMSTNITPNARLHIWDRILVNPRVPSVHSHSYAFHSVVLAGCVWNLRVIESPSGNCWNKVLVSATEGLLPGSETQVELEERQVEIYRENDEYEQRSDEVHWSLPGDGTVTLVEWDFTAPPQHMKVYWRGAVPWLDAKPRQATSDEVLQITQYALRVWF